MGDGWISPLAVGGTSVRGTVILVFTSAIITPLTVSRWSVILADLTFAPPSPLRHVLLLPTAQILFRILQLRTYHAPRERPSGSSSSARTAWTGQRGTSHGKWTENDVEPCEEIPLVKRTSS